MRHKPVLLLSLALAACGTLRRPARSIPPEETAWFKFKRTLPESGRQTLPGAMANAIRLAMNHLLPWNERPPPGADATTRCLRQRQAWDLEVAPWKEGSLLVYASPNPGACQWGGSPLLDMGSTYAVDLTHARILAPSEDASRSQLPQELPRQGLRHLEGNMAAALQLATEDFITRELHPTEGVALQQACLSRLESYDVTAVPDGETVMLVRFDVNDQSCPPPGPPALVEGSKLLPPAFMTTYAIDLRTLRILGIHLTTRQRIVE